MNVQVTAYLPNGFQVTFPLIVNDQGDAFQVLSDYTAQLRGAGFLAAPPALGEGEQVYTITHVMRRTQKNTSKKDGSIKTSPLIYLYHDDLAFSSLKTWLNTPDEIAAFEQATGLKLANIPVCDFPAAIERGKDADIDAKYIVALPKPAKAVWKPNPKYEEGSTTEQKREFVRWDGQATQTPVNAGNAGNGASGNTTGDAWDKSAVETLIAHYAGKLDVDQIKIALGIKDRFGEWTKGKQAAYQAVEAFTKTLELDFSA